MSIYRGEGGSGDATNDATVSDVTAQAVIASTKADEAAASATAAAASATSVQTLTAATGAAGSSASYNAGTNTLTVPRGDTGATGPTGATGSQGIQGIQGIQGATGLTGAAGADGADGADGVDGADGADGTGATTASVTAAGALMDSEVTNLAQVKAFDSTDYATAAQGVLAAAALPKSGGAMTGAITTNSTFDGRDVATDGTKLDGIEASADVTDATNVTAAGALMDSELTSIAAVKALNQGVATTDSPTFAEITSSGDVNLTAGASDWAFTVVSNNLIISYGGVSKAKLDTSGNLIVIGNVTAFGTV